MRAAVLNQGRVLVRDDVAEPTPGFGQALVQVKACGICGSDLHFAKHGHKMVELGKQMEGMPQFGGADVADGPQLDFDADIYLGHEFSAEVLEIGPGTEGFAPGTIVTSIPILFGADGVQPIVYSNSVKAGYGERMLLTAAMMLEVPNGLDAKLAALTEPMAVGMHGVNKSRIKPGEGAIVLGCGPVGLAIIAGLKVKGIDKIVAADFSPARRAIAATMGATEVVDPNAETAWEAWRRVGGGGAAVIFEGIGVPGIIAEIFRAAPHGSRAVIVGVCMETDTFVPYFGISKELNIQFCLGYDPMEFAGCLHSIAEGEIDVTPMITGEVDLDGVAGAFDALGDPEEHCKILVVPGT